MIGALQAYVYAEPAAMFPDKPGGLSVYAREGWRKYFSLAGPIAVFGYWFAWSSVLAVYGIFVGLLLIKEFGGEGYFATESWDAPIVTQPITWPALIGVMCILLCYLFNIRGMRPAVWFSYVVGALMILPVGAIAIGAFLTGDFSNHQINSNLLAETPVPTATRHRASTSSRWSWSGSTSSAGRRTVPRRRRRSRPSTRTRRTIRARRSRHRRRQRPPRDPPADRGSRHDRLRRDPGGRDSACPYLVDVLHTIAGDGFGTFLTVCLCGGLLLSMNTATMDGSRALYALSEEKMTIKQLGVLNKHHVPARAMTVDMLLNMFLVLYFGNIFFILAAGNVGYMLSHVLALSGVLLLRKDRPNWPRPIKLAKPWMVAAGVFCVANLAVHHLRAWSIDYTGYLWDAEFTDRWRSCRR